MNRTLTIVVVLMAVGTSLFARDYRLNERESIDLSRVDEVVIDLNGINCALCIRTIDVAAAVSGDGAGRDMELRLTGTISSNRSRAVPSLIIDKDRSKVTVRLYGTRRTFFGLSQRGTADFTAVLPRSFRGAISISGSSGAISVRDFAVEALGVDSSSGNIVAESLEGSRISIDVSSGRIDADGISASDRLSIESSSGSIDLGSIDGGSAAIRASSGNITVSEASVSSELRIEASSGTIHAGRLSAGTVSLGTSSGDVRIERIEAEDVSFDVSSGRIHLGELYARSTRIETSDGATVQSATGSFDYDGSSGNVDIGFAELDGDIDIEVSSGNVSLMLPAGSGFDARLETSSGRIRSDFRLTGDVTEDRDEVVGTANGGGVEIRVETSSGNIELRER